MKTRTIIILLFLILQPIGLFCAIMGICKGYSISFNITLLILNFYYCIIWVKDIIKIFNNYLDSELT